MNTRTAKIKSQIIPSTFSKPMKEYSSLILKGKWLRELGFNPGDEVNIITSNNQLIIERREP
jgi:hypothetical protein